MPVSMAATFAPNTLFRDREAAIANGGVLLWCSAAWGLSFPLMAAHPGALNIAGILLCTHAMTLAAYLIHEAAHQTLFASHRANRRRARP